MGTRASQTYPEGCSIPKILQQRDANIVKRPQLTQQVKRTGGFTRQAPTANNTRLTRGKVHFDTTSFKFRTSNKPDRERQGRRRKTSEHKLIATKDSWAAI